MRVTNCEWGKLGTFTKRMWLFGIKKRNLENVVQDLKDSCARRREELCADHISSMNSTAYTVNTGSGNYSRTITGGDSLALQSAAHTREDGGTAWSNVLSDGTTSNMDFDYDATRAAQRTASLIRDPQGNLMDIKPDLLVCRRGSVPYFRAMEILGAIKRNEIPGSADNDGSGVMAFKVVPLPYMTTAADAFYAFIDSQMMGPEWGLQYKEGQAVKLEGPNVVFRTGRKIAHYLRKQIDNILQIRLNSCVPCIA